MQKKALFFLLLFLCLLGTAGMAMGETARDITAAATVKAPGSGSTRKRMLDRNKLTALQTDKRREPYVEVTAEEPCAAVYVEFGENIMPFSIQVLREGKWEEIARQDSPFAQSYLAFEPTAQFRVTFDTQGQSKNLYIRELYLFSEGEMDESIVHLWQPPEEKADLLVLAAHPDDEVLWLGGVLPYYAGELGMRVQVAFLTYGNSGRRLELLDSIWHCGVRHYPEIGSFKDVKSYKTAALYKEWGKDKVQAFLTGLLRRYQPEVVVTHALDGESGHAAHKICASGLMDCIPLAADPEYSVKNGREDAPWQVKKLYVHKGGADATVMDWRQPLSRFGGTSAFDVAQEAYRFHKSQPQPQKNEAPTSALYYVAGENDSNSSFVFTLAFSTVGEDEAKNDFLEHLSPELFETP